MNTTGKKKKIFSVVAAVAVVAAAGWSYQQSKQYDGMSELALANVEALARWEDPNEGTGMKKENCYDRGILTGTKCSPSSSKDDKCHYIYDQKGTCN